MNSATTHNPAPRNRHRTLAFTVSLALLISLNLISAGAQSRNQKRITSVWTGTSAAGSIVHVVSDAAVNDYEAYSRGGRFYVKIPAADLPSARGSLLGRGFDDVQIQRYGDGIIISFHLLPGTSARVQQSNNRLEIVFTTPGSSAAARASEIEESNRVRSRRVSDYAGPSPESTRGSAKPTGSLSSRATPRNSNSANETSRSSASNTGKRSGVDSAVDRETSRGSTTAKPSPSNEVAVASPAPAASPLASASPIVGTSGSSSPNAGVSSSASPVSQASPNREPSVAATPEVQAASDDNTWRDRLSYWKIWAQLNWVPILIGSLIALALLAFLFFWRGVKRGDAAVRKWPPLTPALSKNVEEKTASVPEPVVSQANAAAAAAAGNTAAQTPSASTGMSPEPETPKEVDPDREVFEL
ncbi:MAG TPA: hypothetical protein VN643_26160 [Pyrinomonadaceae bacterium]|nr:hypothetical protein [Pyrinomonadaceae bacterium]